jgi:hypothetical protein
MSWARRLILAFALMAGLAPAFAQAPPPVPALPDAERRTSYSISGSTCACAVGFPLYGDNNDYANWLEVYINGVMVPQSGNWTIASPTGSLATIPRPITDAVLTFNTAQTGTVQIVGARRPRRVAQFTEGRGVAARDFNQALNDLTAQNRETWDKTNDVTGRAVVAPPGETLGTLPPAANRANMGVCFDNNGKVAPCLSTGSTTFTAGNGISFSGVNPTTITNNIIGSSPITVTGTNPLTIACATCAIALPTRTAAAAMDLSAFTSMRTAGYSAANDGGGASFQKVAPGTVFSDTFVNCNPCTLVGGSGYTNGTYNGVPLAGGGGLSCVGQVVVAGGTVTQVNFAVPCVTHKVGDALTTANTNIGGSGSGFSYTVSSISSPQASFPDAAGNLWQYVSGGFVNVLQFGCVGDWNGSDIAATNNTNCIWGATAFASAQVAAAAANVFGNKIWFPRGAYMTCGGQFLNTPYNFPVPAGVTFTGMGFGATTLRQCASDPSGSHYISLCDSYMSTGEFGCKIEKMTLDSSAISIATSGVAVIYSNAGQQFTLASDVSILAGLKGCVRYEIGRGGAANDIWDGINCVQADASVAPGFFFNASTTQHVLRNSVCASAPNGGALNCVTNSAGRLIVDTLDVEGYNFGLVQNVTVSGNNGVFRNVQQNSASCTAVIQLANTNTTGNMLFENVATSCSTTIQNGQPGGSNFTGNIVKPITCVSGACS